MIPHCLPFHSTLQEQSVAFYLQGKIHSMFATWDKRAYERRGKNVFTEHVTRRMTNERWRVLCARCASSANRPLYSSWSINARWIRVVKKKKKKRRKKKERKERKEKRKTERKGTKYTHIHGHGTITRRNEIRSERRRRDRYHRV